MERRPRGRRKKKKRRVEAGKKKVKKSPDFQSVVPFSSPEPKRAATFGPPRIESGCPAGLRPHVPRKPLEASSNLGAKRFGVRVALERTENRVDLKRVFDGTSCGTKRSEAVTRDALCWSLSDSESVGSCARASVGP